MSLSFAATFKGIRRERDREVNLGRNGQRGRIETGECDALETNIGAA